ncbi:MAG: hypothetical protein HQK66_01150 [Desulfamplus sp.]|nr:hypothetical protein [Desulfamplus sp.]
MNGGDFHINHHGGTTATIEVMKVLKRRGLSYKKINKEENDHETVDPFRF